jgi:hypothetical protein
MNLKRSVASSWRPANSYRTRRRGERAVALTWTALTEGRWSLVVTKETGSVAASLSPVEHAWADNYEYLIGSLEDGWWLAVEVDGKLTTLASPFPSREAAEQHAEKWKWDQKKT